MWLRVAKTANTDQAVRSKAIVQSKGRPQRSPCSASCEVVRNSLDLALVGVLYEGQLVCLGDLGSILQQTAHAGNTDYFYYATWQILR